MALRRIAYLSRTRDTGRDPFAVTDALDATYRRVNAAAGISGQFVFDGTFFAEALEGEEAALEARLACVRADGWHADVRVLCFDPAYGRRFDGWSAVATMAPRWRLGLGRFFARQCLGDAEPLIDALAEVAARAAAVSLAA